MVTAGGKNVFFGHLVALGKGQNSVVVVAEDEAGHYLFVVDKDGKVERELRIGTRRSRDYALEMLSNKRDTNPPKKHGCIPL